MKNKKQYFTICNELLHIGTVGANGIYNFLVHVVEIYYFFIRINSCTYTKIPLRQRLYVPSFVTCHVTCLALFIAFNAG